MHLNISQSMKMSQTMKLAPRMIQSMEILQLPIMALKERIEQELRDNEMLEDQVGDLDAPEVEMEMERAREEATEKPVTEKELLVDNERNNEADFERLLEISENWSEDEFSGGLRPSSNRVSEDGERKHDAMANMVSRPQSLQEYLIDQFRFFKCSPTVREFGEYLIQNLDNNGRIPSPLPEMIQVFGKPISMDGDACRRSRSHSSKSSTRPASAPAISKSASCCKSKRTHLTAKR